MRSSSTMRPAARRDSVLMDADQVLEVACRIRKCREWLPLRARGELGRIAGVFGPDAHGVELVVARVVAELPVGRPKPLELLACQARHRDAAVRRREPRKGLFEARDQLSVALRVDRCDERLALPEALALERGDDRLPAGLVGVELLDQAA
jgi:hypothetical protein